MKPRHTSKASSAAWMVVIVVVSGVATYLLAVWLNKPAEVTGAVTAAYAALVYYQLREMERQREQQRLHKEEEKRSEWERRPILQVGPVISRFAPEVIAATGQVVSVGYYVNIILTNTGQSLARLCQPIITNFGAAAENGWNRIANWVPIPLGWALDEIHSSVGRPTEERDLVPARPHRFNLGCLSTRHADAFRLLTLLAPTGQINEFGPGEYCVEIRAFSENAEIGRKWYRIRWLGGFTGQENPEEMATKLQVDELTVAPWEAPKPKI